MDPFPRLDEIAHRAEDERGWLQVLYEAGDLVLKRSFSKARVFRGMHVQQAPATQEKVIRVVSGRIIDFVMEGWNAVPCVGHTELGPEMGWVHIDGRLAHGFYALEDTVFEYICDGGYHEAEERAFAIPRYLAQVCGITDPILSNKDRAAQPVA